MTIWYSADLHLGHANIIKYANRPFHSVLEMDSTIINNINNRARKGDKFYIVGDFAFGDHDKYLSQINPGVELYLALGNHDHSNRVKAASRWTRIDRYFEVKDGDIKDPPVVLHHYALRVWNRSHHGAIHLYGHSHGNLPGDAQSLDVGADCWDFKPVSLEEIKVRLATLPKRGGEPDHHGHKV